VSAAPGTPRRVVVLSSRYPHPAARGDQRRVLHIVTGLARRTEVTLVCFGTGPPLPGTGERVRVVSVRRGLLPALAANAAAPDPRLPGQVRLYLDSALRCAAAREIARGPAPVLHATLARMAPYLALGGAAHRHLDLVDALGANMDDRAADSPAPIRAALGLEARLLRRYEARAAAAADSCSLVAVEDLTRAPELARAAIVPNGVDAATFPFAEPNARAPTLLFFGNLGYFPNEAAARFVAHEVLPRVRARYPAARLRLAGHRPSRAVRRLGRVEGVDVVGPVTAMVVELHRAAVAVVPMTTGTGIKNKLLEAFCAGTPVVTNRRGALGIDGARNGHELLLGETPDELAAACARLLTDGAQRLRLAVAARALVERAYTWDRQIDTLLALYAGGARLL
jgi:glycosyltransferase involved in cell wall biosynthesis